jgi:two-component system sensor histidine kinase UhpB
MSAHIALGLLLAAWADAFGVLLVAGIATAVLGFAAATWLSIGAVRQHTPGAIPISVGCLIAAGATLAMMVLRKPFLVGLPLIYYGGVAAIAAALLALTRHMHAMNLQAQRATEYALEAHGRERNRLARDLHDGLGQMLALLRMQMQRMSHKHQGQSVQEVFDESAAQVAATLDELRRIARDLRPAPMQDRGFSEAVREYAAAVQQRTDLSVRVEGDFSQQLGEEIGNELYRITQECLTNCIKHSGARAVVVTLAEVGDRYLLSVVDDGRGLSPDSSSGLGLSTIRERSELLGGKCTISADANGGTRVEVSVPR